MKNEDFIKFYKRQKEFEINFWLNRLQKENEKLWRKINEKEYKRIIFCF